MSSDDRWYKNNTDDKIWWKDTDSVGEWLFSFDKKQVFNMFADYPHNLKIFDEENPEWVDFFKDRQ